MTKITWKNSRAMSLTAVASIGFIAAICGAQADKPPATNPATMAATQPVEAGTFTAAQHDVMVKLDGKNAFVEGTISEFFDASERVLLIRFKDNDRNGFVGVVFNDSAPAAHAWFEGPDGKALIGKTIRVHGTISIYRGNPEIVITDPKQVEMISSPATRPALMP